MNILITSVANKINLIKYFRRALFNEGGGSIFGVDSQVLVKSRLFLDGFEVSPSSDSADYLSWIKAFVKTHKIALIIPSRDGELLALSTIKQCLKDDYACHVMVSKSSALNVCLDKELFSIWCQHNGFNTAKTYQPDDVTKKHLPVFVKPKQASGSKNTLAIKDWASWCSLRESLDSSYLVQDYIDAPEYSVDIFIDEKGSVCSVVPRLRELTQQGESVCGRVCLDRDIIEYTTRLVTTLGLLGQITVQVFKPDGVADNSLNTPIIVSEVNARFGGGFTLSVEAGADTPRYLVQQQLGKPISHLDTVLQNGLRMLRIQKDIIFNDKAIRTYCIDLDGTLCTECCTYQEAKPMAHMVAKINALYAAGNNIVIATARGAASGKCWRELTEQQLKLWGVNYHSLIMGKPYADYYIDNKAVDVLEFL